MGCRFTKTNDTEPELASDSTDLPPGIVTQPLLGTTEYLFDSQTVLTTDATKVFNPITTASSNKGNTDGSSSDQETITPIDYIKNAYSLVRWDTPIRSTFCNRITLKSK
uniref:VP4 n=1 Tax=Elaeophora elaphi TaxID=1147741 RepID=A0A0R3RYS1_9BILA